VKHKVTSLQRLNWHEFLCEKGILMQCDILAYLRLSVTVFCVVPVPEEDQLANYLSCI